MEQFDHIRSLTDTRGQLADWDKKMARGVFSEALSVHSALDEWGSRLSNPSSRLQYYTSRPASSIEILAIDNKNNIYPTSFAFPNWDNAAAFVYHAMSQININTLLIDLERITQGSDSPGSKTIPPRVNTLELTEESIECADRICQSIEYFLGDNRRLIGRMVVLAPFETAKSFFSQLSKAGTGNAEKDSSLIEKVKFCDAVTRRIKDSGLPIG